MDTAESLNAFLHSYGKEVSSGGIATIPRRSDHGRPFSLLPVLRQQPDSPLGRLARLLLVALGEHRYEPWNVYHRHRAYPSARSAFTIDVDVHIGDQRWRFDPIAIALRGNNLAEMSPDTAVRLVPVTYQDRLPAGYGRLREALTLLELGHLAATVVEATEALGGQAQSDPDGSILIERLPIGPPAQHRLDALHRRSSGLGPFGLSTESTLSIEDTDAMMKVAGSAPGLRQHLVLPGGRYRLTSHGLDLEDNTVSPHSIQSGFTYPPSDIDVGNAPAVWLFAADVKETTDYRQLLISAGASAQRIALAAAARGMLVRPCRGIHESIVESAVGLPLEESLIYILVIFRSEVRDFWLDLLPTMEALP